MDTRRDVFVRQSGSREFATKGVDASALRPVARTGFQERRRHHHRFRPVCEHGTLLQTIAASWSNVRSRRSHVTALNFVVNVCDIFGDTITRRAKADIEIELKRLTADVAISQIEDSLKRVRVLRRSSTAVCLKCAPIVKKLSCYTCTMN